MKQLMCLSERQGSHGEVKYHLELNSMKRWSGRQDMFEVR